ncbi:glycine dehydrogenase [Candidatus Acidianus copahuensis]|uniref:glycine dehydrogenase (aminomethyl-transferring) n=1 Tax=Candidatus Acidianus copahuensis TaxID=1160895 RepID=A0A031LQ70_9CREN|nr:aminomethyl-transferring glycine dehydrogenase subunit GcvPB [Candidatus Acidianus copahuensis]EZQ06865.1 glycine dehydrogenase [Candidatus Acidianus copahuensis]
MWEQAKWNEPLIFELKGEKRIGMLIPREELDVEVELPNSLRRSQDPELPELSELEVVRHFTRLSEMNFGVDSGMMPLGSCTMKYNPKIEEIASLVTEDIHPLQDENTTQGSMEMLYYVQSWLAEATGMDECSLAIPAGASGELAGSLMIRKYNKNRDEMLVADTAHGTNPASASMVGFKVIYVKTNDKGTVNLNVLRELVSDKVAGFMLTNPNTLGIFEDEILEIAKYIHSVDGVLYYDGANLNGILGVARPGDMGFDIVHVNLHKTFAVPHGGGGPGAGAVCAKGKMVDFLPYPIVGKKSDKFVFIKPKNSIGRISTYNGNVGNIARAFTYMAGLGPQGISMIGKMSTLATNYLVSLLRNVEGLYLPFPQKYRKHEVVFSAEPATDWGITALDIAKALIDRGFYAPTVYFPSIVKEALMIEPTETEPKEEIEKFAFNLNEILKTAKANPEDIKKTPTHTSIRRLDQVKANHPATITPSYRVKKLREKDIIKLLK